MFLWLLPLEENSRSVPQIQEGVLSLRSPLCSLVKENPPGTILNPLLQAPGPRTGPGQQLPSERQSCVDLSASESPPRLGPVVSFMSHLPIQTQPGKVKAVLLQLTLAFLQVTPPCH